VPFPSEPKASPPSARPAFGSPDVLAQLLALERGACDGGTPDTPRRECGTSRRSEERLQPSRRHRPAPAAAPPGGLERRAAYWRSCAIARRDAAVGPAPSFAPRICARSARIAHERRVPGAVAAARPASCTAARARQALDVGLEQCTFAPKLNAQSLRIDAERTAATGALPSCRALPPHLPPHCLRTSLRTASAPPPWHASTTVAHLGSPPRHLWQGGSGSRSCTGQRHAQAGATREMTTRGRPPMRSGRRRSCGTARSSPNL
jgi:hypothetical protein